jgi:predicted NBD/HSP70 family sugar kinase
MQRLSSAPQVVVPAPAGELSRRANLSLVLSLVHQHQRVSRSELARLTGLNRSTIGSLIATLARTNLVRESAPGPSSTIGRPSPIVQATDEVVALALHPEIDAVTIGVVAMGGEVLHKVRHPTPEAPCAREVVDIFVAEWEAMRPDLERRHRVVGLGVAVPGLTRSDEGVVTYAPHLGWRDEPLARTLSEATDLPVRAANDASLGATAELIFGSGRGVLDLIYANGGPSGVGGGVITRGHPRSGASGYAGELGHTLVNSRGARCHCGAVGCLETEVSLERLQDLVGLRGADIETVERALVAHPSAEADRELDRQADALGASLRNAVNAFNPARIVLGGFLATLSRLRPDRLADAVTSRALRGPDRDVVIVEAVLGADLLMIGAAELAFADVLADPTSEIPAA